MPTLEELSKNIAAFQKGSMSLAGFADWFEDNSRNAYDSADVRAAWIAVDAAFSAYYYDHIGESALKEELGNALHHSLNAQTIAHVEWKEEIDVNQPVRGKISFYGTSSVERAENTSIQWSSAANAWIPV